MKDCQSTIYAIENQIYGNEQVDYYVEKRAMTPFTFQKNMSKQSAQGIRSQDIKERMKKLDNKHIRQIKEFCLDTCFLGEISVPTQHMQGTEILESFRKPL